MSKNQIINIKVAILAEEPLSWKSGKHFFPIILNDYSWNTGKIQYRFKAEYIYDKDIIDGKLDVINFDVFLVPGGGVGDSEVVVKGFKYLGKARKWKKQIRKFVEEGGGVVGICGGAALLTNLVTGFNSKPKTFLERQYDKSSVEISCVKHYYKDLAFPLLYPSQKKYPEKIGAAAYVFSFAPGQTEDGKRIHSGGVPVDFTILKDNPIFKDYKGDTIRIRWWGGPGLIIPKVTERDVKILAYYPEKDLSEYNSTRIYAWSYVGGLTGLFKGFLEALNKFRDKNEGFTNILFYSYLLAKPWKKSNKIIDLNLSNKPAISTEIYPNENKARILLCTAHPEYMIWWRGFIEELDEAKNNCLANGFRKWKEINPLSKTVRDELTYTWWIVRRFTAWVAKIPDNELPPIEKGKINEKSKELIKQNVFWDGTLINQIENF
jgi:hypothetical protein